jgi:hypothetical protein
VNVETFSMSQPVEPMTAASVVSLAVLCGLGLRKLVVMDGLLEVRVIILTALLWVTLFGLLFMACPTPDGDCVLASGEKGSFTISY